MACRGTGSVISNLGGSPNTVACPWCSGTGLRPAEIDAQAHWGERTEDPLGPAGAEKPAEQGEQADEPPAEPGA
jgi:hypothetical protein